MKTIKLIILLFLFSTCFISCTEDDEDYQTNSIENTQATGEDGDNPDDGSKD
jgi:hypothetical protein